MTSLARSSLVRSTLALVAVCVFSVATPVAAHDSSDRHDGHDGRGPLPEVIQLPPLWQAEGIATGRGSTVYSGSLADGAIWRGDLRTAEGSVLVPGSPGNASVGLKYHEGLLFVAGGRTGTVRVYDARTGELVVSHVVGTLPTTFVNDVVVTQQAAWFTESSRAVLYRLALKDGRPWGVPEAVTLTGDWEQVPGFNANGIAATPDGETLLVINTTSGKLYRVHARSGHDHARARVVRTSADLTRGDGILLRGRELDVARNTENKIAVLKLSRGLHSARLVEELTESGFAVPTTIAEYGCALYAVNARFGTEPADATYEILRVDGSCRDSRGSDRDDWRDEEHDGGW